jgi:hypothetical protein
MFGKRSKIGAALYLQCQRHEKDKVSAHLLASLLTSQHLLCCHLLVAHSLEVIIGLANLWSNRVGYLYSLGIDSNEQEHIK